MKRVRFTRVSGGRAWAPEHRRRRRSSVAGVRGLRPALWLSLCIAVAGLAIGAGQALASTGHEFLSSLSEAAPGTTLLEPSSVAVDHATGQVFVGDLSAYSVDVYSSSGEYETQFGGGVIEPAGIAVDEANGDVFVADPSEAAVFVYEPDGKGGYRLLSEWAGQGTPGKAFGEVVGVAFDNSNSISDPSAGDLYVLELEGVGAEGYGTVDLFKPKPNPEHPEEVGEGEGPEGEFIERLSGPKLEEPNGVAVDSATGRVLVADSLKGAVYTYNDSGSYEEKLTGKGSPNGTFKGKEEEGNVAGIGVEEASGDIYVAESERHVVSQYSEHGQWEGWITSTPAGALGEPRAVALDASGDVYVADAGLSLVDRFGPNVVVPDAETGKVAKSELTRTSAVLKGTVNGDGKAAKYRFEWGESEAYGQSTPTHSSGTVEEAVSFTLEGLKAGTSYYFRIVAENENGANYGIGHQFTTPPAVEALSTGAVKDLQPESATLTGSLKRGGLPTHYYFQYGTSSSYGETSPEPPGEVPAGKEEKEEKLEKTLEAAVSHLSPNTSYHYRFVAENSFGTTYGADQKFTTSGPPHIASEPTTPIGHEEATLHAKIDPDQLATTYHFEYGENTAYGSEVPLGGQSIGSGSTPVVVSASLSKLKLGVTYHFRVIASNEAGTTTGPDQQFTTIPPAPIDATYSTEVDATKATLHTEINPLGHDTTYYFQYGTESCQSNPGSCTNTPTPPGEDIGAGEEDVARSAQLDELKPDTTYYYRVLAMNSLGTTEGAQHTFTTQLQATPLALADSRAWEMVSPPDKHGAPVEGLTREGGVSLAAENGDALTYVVDGALGEEVQGNRSPEMQQIIATRTPKGWSSEDVVTPNTRAYGDAPGNPPEYQFFSPDLSLALVEPFGPEPPLAPGVTQKTIYLRDDASGTYLPLVTEADTVAGTQFGGQIHFVDATPDLTHVVIQSTVPLTEAPSGKGLYEWVAGELQFVSLLPAGAPAPESSLGFGGHVIAQAISSDGTRVIWEDHAEGTSQGHLYMRDTAKSETIQLDAAQGVSELEKGSAQFQGASSDGSKVFFTDKQRLTADSTAEPALGKADLYECEMEEVANKLTCHLKDLTIDRGEGEHAAVQGLLLGVDEGGANVYLVAQGVLASNRNANGEAAEAGKDNLYALHESAGDWTTTFIAALSSEDSPEWEGNKVADTAFSAARVSPDGRYFAFMSAAPITGYDNVDQHSGARDEEVYLYDAGAASLGCVSCNPTGARPAGVLDTVESGEGLGLVVDRRKVWAESGHEHWLAGSIPGWTAQREVSAIFQSRYLSNSGRMFFNSPDDLVPQAINGKEDVYEYEPAGVGSCQSPSGACVSLMSSGSSPEESAFLEATANGNDVFFLTAAQLLPQDTDTAFDIYDARVCTQASPCLTPPEAAAPGCSEADACRPAQPAQPIPGAAPFTASFSGPGNVGSPTPQAKQESKGVKQTKPLTSAQKLTKALVSCRKQHTHSEKKRKACESQARKRFGVGHKATVHKVTVRHTTASNARKSASARARRAGR